MGLIGRLEIHVEADLKQFQSDLEAAVSMARSARDQIAATAAVDKAESDLVDSIKVTIQPLKETSK